MYKEPIKDVESTYEKPYWVPLIEIVPHRDEAGKVIWELTTHVTEHWEQGNTRAHSTEYVERTFTSSEEALTAIGEAVRTFERRARER